MKSIVLFPNDSTIYPYLLIVEITIGYLTLNEVLQGNIYNSRNYYRLLNSVDNEQNLASTTVEITIGYLTIFTMDA